GEGAAARRRPGTSGDLLGVRPYRRGDSLRRVHWPQSARHETLIVCELECRATPVVQVVLDLDAAAHAGTGPESSREWAIRVAASYAEDWIGQGAEVELIFGAKIVSAGPGSTVARRNRVLDALARIDEEPAPPLGDLLRSPACRAFEGGLRIIVATDRSAAGSVAPERPRSGPPERFIIMKADAFGPDEDDGRMVSAPPAWFRPWLLLDDPDHVAARLRGGWKELPSHALS
ncbi:DUF58 domain-containing protein, partial [Paludisphaera soli]|uniref:DUF58 domain-containing protein n=1 Tax=Paludisphaera soli TaxID=2712865 RepID=UPI0013EDD6B0